MTLEQLLNKLLERGWKPFGRNYERYEHWCLIHEVTTKDGLYSYWQYPTTLREFCVKESWLWQFCIANHLLKKYSDLWDDDEYVIWRWQNWMDWKTTDWEYIDENYDSDIYHQDESYQYRIIESSLIDEDKLEQFLLENIKVEWK